MVSDRGGGRRDASGPENRVDGEGQADSTRNESPRGPRARGKWSRRPSRWSGSAFPSEIRGPEGRSVEEALHELARDLAEAVGEGVVVQTVTAAARRIAGSDDVEFVANRPGVPPPSPGTAVELRRVGEPRGWLVMDDSIAWRSVVRRRLETLGAMASCALDRLDALDRAAEAGRLAPRAGDAEASTNAADRAAEETDLGFYPSASTVHDATFLNAVFPFALGQARRHGESLSVLCAAIDRLGGIRDLLGPDQVDRTVEHTGRKIATLIRASDIVARLDDDRIMVLLPRADLEDALGVARKLCQSVAENASLLSDAPMLTLSIGVASYPSCATNLYELLEASDAALSDAQGRGRNRAAAAPVLAPDREPRREAVAIP